MGNMHSRHRHLLVAPIFALALVLSVAQRPETGMGSVLSGGAAIARGEVFADEDLLVALPDGVRGSLKAGGSMVVGRRAALLKQGSVLLAADGPIALRVGEATTVRGVAGAFVVIAEGSSLTVAALTTPVLVEWRDQRVIVPIGTQWRSSEALQGLRGDIAAWARARAVTLLPESYVREQIDLAASLAPPDAPARGALLAELAGDPEPDAGDPDAWLLHSFHPQLRAAVWTLPDPLGIPRSTSALRLLRFASSDLSPKPLPSVLVDRWRGAVAAFLATEEKPAAFLEELVRASRVPLRALAARGHPQRAHRIAEALISAVRPYAAGLPPAGLAAFTDLRRFDASLLQGSVDASVALPAPTEKSAGVAVVPSAPGASSSSSAAALSAAEIEQRAYALLRDAGAVFTVHTKIEAAGPALASVQGLVFGGKSGDRSFDFTLDLAREEVRGIAVGGRGVPFPMPFADFIAWARR